MQKQVMSIAGITVLVFCCFGISNAATPVVHWTFDGVATNSGSGGAAYDGTLSGAVAYTNGISGQGLCLLGGSEGYAKLSYTFGNQGTVAFWYKPARFFNYNSVFDNSINSDWWEMWVYADGRIRGRIKNTDSSGVEYDLDNMNGTNHWYHVAFSWDNVTTNITRLYINGDERDTGTITGWVAPGNDVYFGGHSGNTPGEGVLDDVRVYDTALTAEEIQAVHAEIAELSPVVHVTLDESTNNVGTGGARYDASLYGSPVWTNGWNNKGESLVLDGVDDYVSVPYRLSSSGSIAMWYYAHGPWYNWNSVFDNSVSGNDHECWIDSGGWLRYRPASWQPQVASLLGSGSNRWFHIVCTWDAVSTNTVLYVNGVKKSRVFNTSGNNWPLAGNNFYIGGGNAGNTPARGYVSDLQIFETPLGSNRVSEVYSEFSQRGELLAYLPFDGTFEDVAGSNAVVVSGSPTFVKAQVIKGISYDPAVTPGNGGSCVSVSNVLGSSVGTIAFWYYARGPWYNYQPVMDNSVYQEYWESWIYEDGRFAIRVSNLPGGGMVAYDLDNLQGSNCWYHIGFTWDREARNTKLYIDGDLRATASLTDSGWVDPDSTLNIGSIWSANKAANAVWDEVRVYNRALTKEQMVELTIIPPPPPPVGTIILLR